MWWWIGAIAAWLFGLIWIVMVMAGVFRNKEKAWSPGTFIGYLVHGGVAILALWLFMKAIG